MTKSGIIFLASLLLTTPACAAPVPEYRLNADFENCMDGENPLLNTQRAAYCNCVRDHMRDLDLDTYNAAVTSSVKGDADPNAQKLSDIARQCVAQTLR